MSVPLPQDDYLQYGKRSWLSTIPFLPKTAPPPKQSIENSDDIPESRANFLDLITFGWMNHVLTLGYSRPLEPPDLYKLQEDRLCGRIGGQIARDFEEQQKRASEYNTRLSNGEVKPGWRVLWWTLSGKRSKKERHWREKGGRKKASLAWAMNSSVKWWFWSAGIIKVIGDTAQVLSPLAVKSIIRFSTASYNARRNGTTAPPVGQGIGFAFLLLILQMIASLGVQHSFYRGTSTGVLLRGGLISAIYSRSLRLTSRARSKLPNGLLMNHISTDVSRIDFACMLLHMVWTTPIMLVICLVILLLNLGPSALAGYAFLGAAVPLLSYVMGQLFHIRAKSMVWTDKRAKLLQELLGGMKVIKFFTWEIPFLKRIGEYRQNEMRYIRTLLIVRAATFAAATSMPVLAAVLSFVTYAAIGNSLEADVIFTSLTLFNLLRMPLMFLPNSISALTDALNAAQRLTPIFEAETLEQTYVLDPDLDVAIEVKGASFTWDAPPEQDADKDKGKKPHPHTKHFRRKAKAEADISSEKLAMPENVFGMKDITLSIPRGQLVAIVGTVGAGKTSLLQGIIGEMRKTSGSITIGGSVAYCSQSAWIQNATIRENICFGRAFEEERYWKAVEDSCLAPDLEVLANGDLTEVGEKGISLSGGQKQRINICRAIYCDTDIQIFDDPLSALDAHVGRSVFQNVFQSTLSGKTRILVTHALHFLPQVDYIYNVAGGRVAEQGTYAQLMERNGSFSQFVKEFASVEEVEEGAKTETDPQDEKVVAINKDAVAGAAIMQKEERNTGAVGWHVYKEYAAVGHGYALLPILLLSLVLVQGATVLASYWLVFWQELQFGNNQRFYMGVYAGLGIAQAVAFFVMGGAFALLTYLTSQQLHRRAIERVMRAPMSFFETTPLGRIMNRFSKDIDTVDNLLGDSFRMLLGTMSSIVGAVVLISIVLPWFLIAVFVIFIIYYYAAVFYRASAREIKRLDSILRSAVYSHFSESLTGLTTIRAYAESERFLLQNDKNIDIQNRAYWLLVANQRWLGIRLDFLGIALTFSVAMLTIATRFTISPAQTGVTLSYILSVQQAFGWLVRQTAELENNMNSVERIVHYAKNIEQERSHEIPEKKLDSSWPSQGKLDLRGVGLKYRPELPEVLKDLTMDIQPGEKVGIVGRTGAGKSSIMTALYRIVEPTGKIALDGVNISELGLTDLRKALAIIPQEPTLFSGTLRSNLDPFNIHDDATLWNALKRSYLVESSPKTHGSDGDSSGTHTPTTKFTLDSVIEEEGANLSVGQRSLVSLARALVRDTKILILDEATASVDYETDRKIQETISNEFHDRTILCIAHRLRTIISYDRICVLDAGQVAEFDTPAQLYEKTDGIFRGMCERSSITLEDIRLASKTTRIDGGKATPIVMPAEI